MVRKSLGESSEYPEGGMAGVSVGDNYLLVARIEGKLYAIDGKCSHMGSDLSKGRLEGYLVTCRLHGAQFDLRTGTRVRNMAASSLSSYDVMELDGKAFVELP